MIEEFSKESYTKKTFQVGNPLDRDNKHMLQMVKETVMNKSKH